MAYNNYDLIETGSGDLFMKLSSKFYCLSVPTTSESHARTKIDRVKYGSHRKVGNLRVWIADAFVPKDTDTSSIPLEELLTMSAAMDGIKYSGTFTSGT